MQSFKTETDHCPRPLPGAMAALAGRKPMFNLLSRPWTEDPEFSHASCETGLRLFRGTLLGTDDLAEWARAFAALSEERAEALHARVRDYIRAEDGSAQAVRAETAQLDRDTSIAHQVERLSRSNSGSVSAHEMALCAAHLANTHVLRLALLKLPEGQAGRAGLKALYDKAVALSDTLIALAAAPGAGAERDARARLDALF